MKIKPIHIKLIVVLLLNSVTIGVAWYAQKQAEDVAVVADQIKEHNQRIFTLTVKYPESQFIRSRVVSPLIAIFWIQLLQAVVLFAPMKWPFTETEDESRVTAAASNA